MLDRVCRARRVIVKDKGYVYLGGPPLVKAATGEVVSDMELGGAEVHCDLSGATDHYAEDENEAFAIARDIAETLKGDGDADEGDGSLEGKAPLFPQSDLAGLVPVASADSSSSSSDSFPTREILARLLDGSELHEFKPRYGRTVVTGFARVDGQLCGVVASNGPLLGSKPDDEPSAAVVVGTGGSQ